MNTRTSVWQMGDALAFRAPDGSVLEATTESLELFFEDDELSTCDLTFKLSAATYGIIDEQELFQLAHSERGPGSATFHPEGEVVIEARLADQFLALIAVEGEGAEAAAGVLSAAPVDSPLRAAQSWYALHVTEDVDLPAGMEGSLRMGYTTTWNEDGGDGGDDAADRSLLDIVKDYLADEEVECTRIPDLPAVAFRFEGTDQAWDCAVIADDDSGIVLFYSISPEAVPPKKRPAVAEYMVRANAGLSSGNFEMNWDTGEVRFKTSIDVRDAILTPVLFARVCENNAVAMDTFLGGLIAVTQGAEPRTEVAKAEASR